MRTSFIAVLLVCFLAGFAGVSHADNKPQTNSTINTPGNNADANNDKNKKHKRGRGHRHHKENKDVPRTK